MTRYKVVLNSIIIYEIDSGSKAGAIEYAKFILSRDAEKISVKKAVVSEIGPTPKDLEDLS